MCGRNRMVTQESHGISHPGDIYEIVMVTPCCAIVCSYHAQCDSDLDTGRQSVSVRPDAESGQIEVGYRSDCD